MTHTEDLPNYRVLTGPDDAAFCRRVSEMLDLGYELHGSPSLTFDGERVIVGQALVRPAAMRISDRIDPEEPLPCGCQEKP